MFLCGVTGSSATTNVAGTIADMFGDIDGAGQAMAMFVISANAGPSIGAPLGSWISQQPDLGFRWIFYLNCIMGVVFTICCCFLEETLPRLAIAAGARAAEKHGEISPYESSILNTKIDLFPEMFYMVAMTFKLVFTEPIIWVLAIFNGCTYGLLFLYLAGIHQVFVMNNGLTYVSSYPPLIY